MGLLANYQNNDPILRTNAAAELLGLKPRTLANWRSKRIGPEFIKLGTHIVGYRLSALEAFLHNETEH